MMLYFIVAFARGTNIKYCSSTFCNHSPRNL